jgi:hypothetical protein
MFISHSKKFEYGQIISSSMIFHVVNQTKIKSLGVMLNVLVKVGKFYFSHRQVSHALFGVPFLHPSLLKGRVCKIVKKGSPQFAS